MPPWPTIGSYPLLKRCALARRHRLRIQEANRFKGGHSSVGLQPFLALLLEDYETPHNVYQGSEGLLDIVVAIDFDANMSTLACSFMNCSGPALSAQRLSPLRSQLAHPGPNGATQTSSATSPSASPTTISPQTTTVACSRRPGGKWEPPSPSLDRRGTDRVCHCHMASSQSSVSKNRP